MGQSGFGNRMMSLVSGLWLCILAKIPKIVILEEPCKWCPGSVNGVFELPTHMRTVGIQSIDLVPQENRDWWLTWADDLCDRKKSGAVENVPSSALHAEIRLGGDG